MGELGINSQTLLAQAINFAILFVILRLVAYKPIMRMLDERSKKIKDSLDQTEQIKQQAENAEAEVKKQLEVASSEGREMVARAVRTGEELRQGAQEQAKQDAETIVGRARVEIQRERDEAIDELRQEFADLAILAAEKVIDRSLDKKAHQELIDKVLEEGTTLKKG